MKKATFVLLALFVCFSVSIAHAQQARTFSVVNNTVVVDGKTYPINNDGTIPKVAINGVTYTVYNSEPAGSLTKKLNIDIPDVDYQRILADDSRAASTKITPSAATSSSSPLATTPSSSPASSAVASAWNAAKTSPLPAGDLDGLNDPVTLNNPSQFGTISSLVNKIPEILVSFIGVGALFGFLMGAYMYFISGGNEDGTGKGKVQMVGSIIALFIVLSAAAIVNLASKFFATGK